MCDLCCWMKQKRCEEGRCGLCDICTQGEDIPLASDRWIQLRIDDETEDDSSGDD